MYKSTPNNLSKKLLLTILRTCEGMWTSFMSGSQTYFLFYTFIISLQV